MSRDRTSKPSCDGVCVGLTGAVPPLSHLVLLDPGSIAACALYLASDESRMVTGQVLPVDSGVTIS